MNSNITIFTPTYNRAYLLNNAYQSLCQQTSKKFEWLIIDDGSTDNTEELVNNWVKEKKLEIKYIKKNNEGKHIAINTAISICKNKYMLCLDSDDILIDNAIEELYKLLKTNSMTNIWAIVGPRAFLQKNKKNCWPKKLDDIQISKLCYLYDKYKYKGETYMLWNLDYLKEYTFPKFREENFVPEDLLYSEMDMKYNVLLYSSPLYIFEYQEDGYTKSGIKMLIKNPNGHALVNLEKSLKNIYSYKTRILSYARYKAMKGFFKLHNEDVYKKNKNIIVASLGSILSIMFYYNYKLKCNRYKEKNGNVI